MENKVMRYIWIASCATLASVRLIMQLSVGGFDTGALSIIAASYILLLVTAIIYEFKLKNLFYIFLPISLILFVYGHFFAWPL